MTPLSETTVQTTERLRLRHDAVLERDDGGMTLVEGHVCTRLGTPSPGIVAALERLAEDPGAEEDALADLVAARDGERALMTLGLLLRRIERGGWLERSRYGADGERALATLQPIGHQLAPVLVALDPEAPIALSRFAYLRAYDGLVVLETPTASLRVVLHEPRLASLVAALALPRTPSALEALATGLDEDGASLGGVLALLHRAGLLVAPGAEDERALAQWAFADLLFHARSRIGRHLGGYGGTYPLAERFEALEPVRAPWEPGLELPRADLDALAAGDPPLSAVLESRRSLRRHDDEAPISLEQLGAFLYRVGRNRAVFEDGRQELLSRPYPAGGALYELEFYPLVHRCTGIEPGLYHYDPARHALGSVAPAGPRTRLLLEYAQRTGVMESPPQVVLLIAARFGRIMWKYESMAYAAILKHVGVLYQTMYLVATAMGLAPCGLGGGHSDAFGLATGLSFYEETTVGEFLLGSRAAEQPVVPGA
jgi:SagB-type dehydrogenase family enzyme